jgi:uncharacterized protein (DUF2141 family)
MKKYALLLLFSISFIYQLKAQVELKIEIVNLKNDSGKILLELIDTNQERIDGKSGTINNRKSTIIFGNIKKGKIAARYFHDENSNDELDTNTFGIPKENYGISNNAYGMFGPKNFEKWLFTVDKDTVIEIKTNR